MNFDMPSTAVADIFKALDDIQERDKGATPADPKSAFIDPFNITNYLGPRAKPGPVSYAILRHMAQVPAVAAIINTRLNQVANFTHRARNDRDTGFRIVLKDEEAKLDDGHKKQAQALEEFFLRTGFVKNRKRKDNFNQFMRKLARDSLILDDIAIEAVEGVNARKWPISELYAIDAGTIEVVVHAEGKSGPHNYVYQPETDKGKQMHPEDIAYVQRVNGLVQAEYSEDELIRNHRNPRTDIDYAFFGYSELETLIVVVTGILNGLTYNTSYFTQSNLPQGVLEIVGKYSQENMEQFKRAWTTLVSGTVGKWKVPVMAMEEGQGLKFTPFKQSNRDMEYSQFMEFLFNLACAVYQINPQEVGFKSWDAGGGSKLSDNDAPASKMEQSKDKGFYPLMQFFEDTFNYDILDRIAPDFRFEWVGLDEDRSAQEWAMEKDQLAAGALTLRMYWDKHDVDYTRYENEEWIDAPANAQLVGLLSSKMQGQQQMQQADQQHQNALEAQLHGGIQQSSLEQAKQKAAAAQLDQQHQNSLEAGLHQGAQQVGLEKTKLSGQKELATMGHAQKLEQGAAQAGHTQTLEEQKQGAAQKMAGLNHTFTLRQKMADAGHGRGAEAFKHKNAKDLAEHGHGLSLEQMMLQGTQQAGLEQTKLKGQKELQTGQQNHQLEQQARQGMQAHDMANLSHRLVLKQKFADAGHNRGAQAQKQRGAERMMSLKTEQAAGDKKKKDLNKSLAWDGDVIEIEIVLS